MNRAPVPFDPQHFAKTTKTRSDNSTKAVFTEIHATNHWGGDSRSGDGAAKAQVKAIQQHLPQIVKDLGVKVFLDLPCGDFNWMKEIDLGVEQYIGGDIVEALVQHNQQHFTHETRSFHHINLLTDDLPAADMVFCRDCLVHLSFADIQRAFENLKRAKIPYLMTTTFTDCLHNEDITTGDWHILNLEMAPFNLPPPLYLLNEGCTEGEGTYADKSLGVWGMGSRF